MEPEEGTEFKEGQLFNSISGSSLLVITLEAFEIETSFGVMWGLYVGRAGGSCVREVCLEKASVRLHVSSLCTSNLYCSGYLQCFEKVQLKRDTRYSLFS